MKKWSILPLNLSIIFKKDKLGGRDGTSLTKPNSIKTSLTSSDSYFYKGTKTPGRLSKKTYQTYKKKFYYFL
ncbi:TPA: hypothetical protein DCX16_04505 [bacterium]|nr:hypothetical protein [bacterium]